MAVVFEHTGCDLRLVRAVLGRLVEVRALEYREGGVQLEALDEFWQQHYFDLYRRYEKIKFMDQQEAETLARRIRREAPFLQGVYVLAASEASDVFMTYPEGAYLCHVAFKGVDFTQNLGIVNEEDWQTQLPQLEEAERRRAKSQEGK